MIKKGYVDTKNGQIHYYQAGENKGNPIIFIHQNVSGGKMYEKTLALLGKKNWCIALDLPGFGESFEPPPFTSISSLTRYTIEFIDALGIDKFHVFGNHTGAGMAAEIASLLSNRVLSCMMIGALLLTEEQAVSFREEFSGSVGPSHNAEYLKATWDYIYNLGGSLDLENMNNEYYASLRAWKARGMIYECVWDYQFSEFIEKIKCPTLLMCSPDDVLYLGHKNTAAAMPNAKAVDIKGGNFEPYFDAPGIYQNVLEFFSDNAFI